MLGAVDTFTAASQHCDIVERLARVTPDQQVRGVWFAMLHDEVRRRGETLGAAFDAEVGAPDYVTFRMYPVADYLRRLVVAGARVASPERVHEGMRDLHRESVRYFARSVVGRAFVSLIRFSQTPLGLFQQVARSRSHIATYGRWLIEPIATRRARVRIEGEPVYVESAQVGGILSVCDMCGVRGEIEHVEMLGPFDGIVEVSW